MQHQHAPQSYFKKMFFILKYCSEFEFTSVYVKVTEFLNLKKNSCASSVAFAEKILDKKLLLKLKKSKYAADNNCLML